MTFKTQFSAIALSAALLAGSPALAQLGVDLSDGVDIDADLGVADAEVDIDLGGDPDVAAGVGIGDDDANVDATVDLDDGVDADVGVDVGDDVSADVGADVDLGGDDGIGADVDVGVGIGGDDGGGGAGGGGNGGGGNGGAGGPGGAGGNGAPGVPPTGNAGGNSSGGGLAMSNGVFCDAALAGQILGLIQAAQYASGAWQSATSVSLVEIELCSELLSQLQAAAASQQGALQNAIVQDPLVSATLNRNGVGTGEVLVVWPQGGTLTVYIG